MAGCPDAEVIHPSRHAERRRKDEKRALAKRYIYRYIYIYMWLVVARHPSREVPALSCE